MRAGVVCAMLLTFCAGAAVAQPVAIPFAPPVPSVFQFDAAYTLDEDGAQSVGRMSASLAFQGHENGLRAIWTVLGAEGRPLTELDVTPYMVGIPISVALNEHGAIREISDLNSILLRLQDKIEELPLPLRAEGAPHSMAGMALAPPLAMLSGCQHTELHVGVPDQTEQFAPLTDGYISHRRSTLELRSVEGGEARVEASYLAEITAPDPSDEPLARGSMTHLECVVDLSTGMVRRAVFEVSPLPAELGGRMQVELTVSRQ